MHIQNRSGRRSTSVWAPLSSLYLCSLLAIAPATVIAGTGPSKAAETVSVKISLAGLDLATTAGSSRAEQRVAAAALQVCERFSDSRKIDDRETLKLCYETTFANAMQQLTALLVATRATRSEVARNIP
jgi:UrcA family protein